MLRLRVPGSMTRGGELMPRSITHLKRCSREGCTRKPRHHAIEGVGTMPLCDLCFAQMMVEHGGRPHTGSCPRAMTVDGYCECSPA